MDENLIARASVTINAPSAKVWNALIDPEAIKQYMFGTNVASDWTEGSPITWRGEWKGKPYEDKGTIVEFKPRQRLRYTHFSPLAGLPDEPGNYHNVTIELSGEGEQTSVSLTQDKNPSEEARAESEKNWGTMLTGLKKYLEQGSAS